MMDNQRFAVKFSKEAAKEYDELDGSILPEVNTALDSLVERADEVGKRLGKKSTSNLSGSKEKKLASSGVRIIYVITNKTINVLKIALVLLVDFKKNDTVIYQEAEKRLQFYQEYGIEDIYEMDLYYYSGEEDVGDLNKPSMLDEIYDENFDSFSDPDKEMISDLVNHGDVSAAHELWKQLKWW
jgi:mRNA-degrading endonuclease RelE of RelBE toxin-antitoxin system